MMTSNQKTFMKMMMMRIVRVTGAMSTQRRRTVMEMKIPEALMNTTASVKRKEAAADHRCGANTLWMCRRNLAMIVPMTWIQTDDPMRFYHRPLRALTVASATLVTSLGFLA